MRGEQRRMLEGMGPTAAWPRVPPRLPTCCFQPRSQPAALRSPPPGGPYLLEGGHLSVVVQAERQRLQVLWQALQLALHQLGLALRQQWSTRGRRWAACRLERPAAGSPVQQGATKDAQLTTPAPPTSMTGFFRVTLQRGGGQTERNHNWGRPRISTWCKPARLLP